MKHLWEIEHAYYCNEGNYLSGESVGENYENWKDFAEEYKDVDKDYNLLFRYDWMEEDGQNVLKIFWVGQRKGLYRYSIIKVLKSDEQKIIEFLLPFWKHMKKLWHPISDENKP